MKIDFLKCTLSESEVTVKNFFCEESQIAFNQFSGFANRSTGRQHPMDEERWLFFLFSTLKNDEIADSETIRNFFLEDGWDEEQAYSLGYDYEYGVEAMKFAVKRVSK